MFGNLRHASIGLPEERGLYAPFNHTISIHPKKVALGKDGLMRAAFQNWLRLLADIRTRPSHVNKLVGQPISDVGNMDALGIGAGDVWISADGSYPSTVWRVKWVAEISR